MLTQQGKHGELIPAAAKALKEARQQKAKLYNTWYVTGAVASFCGWITIIANASGPIFDVYLLSCGLSMDAFVATRGVFMLGSNMFKVISRLLNGSVSLPMLYHGITVVRVPRAWHQWLYLSSCRWARMLTRCMCLCAGLVDDCWGASRQADQANDVATTLRQFLPRRHSRLRQLGHAVYHV